MPIYCMKCGASLPDDAAFCLKCGKQIKGSSTSSTSSSSETELYHCEVSNVYRFMDRYEDASEAQEQGGGTCSVTNRRVVFQTSKNGVVQVWLKDIKGVKAETDHGFLGFIIPSYIVTINGFGYCWCKNKGEHFELSSHIKKAILQI